MIYLSILELHSTYTTSTTTYATYYTRQAANRSHLLLLQVLYVQADGPESSWL